MLTLTFGSIIFPSTYSQSIFETYPPPTGPGSGIQFGPDLPPDYVEPSYTPTPYPSSGGGAGGSTPSGLPPGVGASGAKSSSVWGWATLGVGIAAVAGLGFVMLRKK